jgi:hypothetical protein
MAYLLLTSEWMVGFLTSEGGGEVTFSIVSFIDKCRGTDDMRPMRHRNLKVKAGRSCCCWGERMSPPLSLTRYFTLSHHGIVTYD